MEPKYENQAYDYEEIDLREIIATLGKWKYIILGITLGAMLLAGLVSLFMQPVYEARTVVEIHQLSHSSNYVIKEDNELTQIKDNIDNLVQIPETSPAGYQEQIISEEVLNNTIKKLDLPYSSQRLKNMIKTQLVKDSSLIEIKVSHNNPSMAARIANGLRDEFISYTNYRNAQSITRFEKSIENQLVQEENQLKIANAKLTQGAEAGASPAQQVQQRNLADEVSMRQSVIGLLNTKLVELKIVQSIYLAESSITNVSTAAVPEKPIKPNKMLNVAIAGVLGLMVSTLGVFLAEYLRTGK